MTQMFVRPGLILTGIGLAAGMSVSLTCQHALRSMLFGVSPLAPWTYSIAALSILAVAFVASYLPSRRAAAVNPVHALRAE